MHYRPEEMPESWHEAVVCQGREDEDWEEGDFCITIDDGGAALCERQLHAAAESSVQVVLAATENLPAATRPRDTRCRNQVIRILVKPRTILFTICSRNVGIYDIFLR